MYQEGAGTWTLSGANGFTNALTVDAGRLILDYADNTVLSGTAAVADVKDQGPSNAE